MLNTLGPHGLNKYLNRAIPSVMFYSTITTWNTLFFIFSLFHLLIFIYFCVSFFMIFIYNGRHITKVCVLPCIVNRFLSSLFCIYSFYMIIYLYISQMLYSSNGVDFMIMDYSICFLELNQYELYSPIDVLYISI